MFVAVATILSGGKAHAASFTVATGSDENTNNSSCALSEAIENINDQATTNTDCSPTGTYGTDDTINLPAGTITLTADLPDINQSVTIQGQGMDSSVINGDNHKVVLLTEDSQISDLTILAFNSIAIKASNTNLNVRRVEIDGTGGSVEAGSSTSGIESYASTGSTYNINLEDVYIHNLPGSTISADGLDFGASNDSVQNINANRVTVSDITDASESGTMGISMTNRSTQPGTVNASLRNITITGLSSSTGSAGGIVAFAVINGGEVDITMDITNSTVNNLNGAIYTFGIAGIGYAVGSDDTVNITINSTNSLLSNVPCLATVYPLGPTPAGTHNLSIISGGGNLSNDNACSSYFAQPTDQNNVTNLSSSLAALANNGGYVPTMALLPGSPAIDAGINVADLTTDARLVSRPQGVAFDSGAYEHVPSTATTNQSLALTGQSQVTALGVVVLLVLPAATFAIRRKVTA